MPAALPSSATEHHLTLMVRTSDGSSADDLTTLVAAARRAMADKTLGEDAAGDLEPVPPVPGMPVLAAGVYTGLNLPALVTALLHTSDSHNLPTVWTLMWAVDGGGWHTVLSTDPTPGARLPGQEQDDDREWAIEFHAAPGRWLRVEDTATRDRVTVDRAVQSLGKAFADVDLAYRLVSRTPASAWQVDFLHPTASRTPGHHEFTGVAGHPDDNECTYRSDGTDTTYCGEPMEAFVHIIDDSYLAEHLDQEHIDHDSLTVTGRVDA
jgi:hypothetical protein